MVVEVGSCETRGSMDLMRKVEEIVSEETSATCVGVARLTKGPGVISYVSWGV